MSIATALKTYLDAHAGLDALVDKRIHPLRIPPDAVMPCVIYQRISSAELHMSNYVKPRFQFRCWSETDTEADAIALQLRDALNEYHGMMGSLHVLARVLNRRDTQDPNTALYCVLLDAELFYQETI